MLKPRCRWKTLWHGFGVYSPVTRYIPVSAHTFSQNILGTNQALFHVQILVRKKDIEILDLAITSSNPQKYPKYSSETPLVLVWRQVRLFVPFSPLVGYDALPIEAECKVVSVAVRVCVTTHVAGSVFKLLLNGAHVRGELAGEEA